MGVISTVNTTIVLNGIEFQDLEGEDTAIEIPDEIERYMVKPTADGGAVFHDTGVRGGETKFRLAPTSATAKALWEIYIEDYNFDQTTLWGGEISNWDTGAKVKCDNGVMVKGPPFFPAFSRDEVGPPVFTIYFVIMTPDVTAWEPLSLRESVITGNSGRVISGSRAA